MAQKDRIIVKNQYLRTYDEVEYNIFSYVLNFLTDSIFRGLASVIDDSFEDKLLAELLHFSLLQENLYSGFLLRNVLEVNHTFQFSDKYADI